MLSDYFAALLRTNQAFVAPTQGKLLNYIQRVPLGVVAQITVSYVTSYSILLIPPDIKPFNHPLLIAIKKIAPALAAGNSVVVKPSEVTCSDNIPSRLLILIICSLHPSLSLNLQIWQRLLEVNGHGRALCETNVLTQCHRESSQSFPDMGPQLEKKSSVTPASAKLILQLVLGSNLEFSGWTFVRLVHALAGPWAASLARILPLSRLN